MENLDVWIVIEVGIPSKWRSRMWHVVKSVVVIKRKLSTEISCRHNRRDVVKSVGKIDVVEKVSCNVFKMKSSELRLVKRHVVVKGVVVIKKQLSTEVCCRHKCWVVVKGVGRSGVVVKGVV